MLTRQFLTTRVCGCSDDSGDGGGETGMGKRGDSAGGDADDSADRDGE